MHSRERFATAVVSGSMQNSWYPNEKGMLMDSAYLFNRLFGYSSGPVSGYLSKSKLKIAASLGHGQYLRELHRQAVALQECVDLTDLERVSTHFLAVLTRYQDNLYFFQHSGNRLSVDESIGIDGLKGQLRQACHDFCDLVSDREAKVVKDILDKYLNNLFTVEPISKPLNRAVAWQETARQLADEYFASRQKQGDNPKLDDISDAVCKQMIEQKILGAQGRVLGSGAIKRDALQAEKWYQKRFERYQRNLGEKGKKGEHPTSKSPPEA